MVFLRTRILRVLSEKVSRILGECKYASICPYYRPDSYTCSVFDAENGYCGQYRRFIESELEVSGVKGKGKG
jgi:hypothetical protein